MTKAKTKEIETKEIEIKNVKAIESTIDNKLGVLTLAFANDKVLEIALDSLDVDIMRMATLHGLKQKLVDAAAISRDPATGKSATIETKFDAVTEVYHRLQGGQWNKKRPGCALGGGVLYLALCRLYDGTKTPEELREFLATKSRSDQSALRTNPKITEVINQIRAERASDVDTDSLLEELEG